MRLAGCLASEVSVLLSHPALTRCPVEAHRGWDSFCRYVISAQPLGTLCPWAMTPASLFLPPVRKGLAGLDQVMPLPPVQLGPVFWGGYFGFLVFGFLKSTY